jgi:hypothetical protein
MAPPLPSSARLRLKYPLYGCDFDPLSSSYLVVGGGGGEGNSGLPKTAIVSEATRRCRSEHANAFDILVAPRYIAEK